jgi:plasmid stabilization system protein ParE
MKVRYTRKALAEINSIISYIARDNERASDKVAEAIREAVELISRRPEISPFVFRQEIRGKMVGRYPYRIFYTVGSDEVVIRNVRSARRRLPWNDAAG